MALTEQQRNRVWEKMTDAQKRAIYFGGLANRHARAKRFCARSALFLSLGTVIAAIVANPLVVLPIAIASVFLSLHLLIVDADDAAPEFARLHYQWNQLAAEYERLWNHWHEDAAEGLFRAADRLECELNAWERGPMAAIEAVMESQAEHEERKRKISESIANGARISRNP